MYAGVVALPSSSASSSSFGPAASQKSQRDETDPSSMGPQVTTMRVRALDPEEREGGIVSFGLTAKKKDGFKAHALDE